MHEKLTVKERFQALQPGQIIWPLIIILVLLGTGVGIYNYQKNIAATKQPTVAIASPEDNAALSEAQTTITGSVDKNSTVTVNNKSVPVDEAGSFSADLKLVPGINTLTIVATGKNGKSTIVTRRITRDVPAPVISNPAGVANQAVAGSLASSGPENFWIPEASLVAAAIVGWYMTRQKLVKALAKRA